MWFLLFCFPISFNPPGQSAYYYNGLVRSDPHGDALFPTYTYTCTQHPRAVEIVVRVIVTTRVLAYKHTPTHSYTRAQHILTAVPGLFYKNELERPSPGIVDEGTTVRESFIEHDNRASTSVLTTGAERATIAAHLGNAVQRRKSGWSAYTGA